MKKKQGGFTLLEILVVLTIMGFLIAMVAPRLALVSSTASGTVCDTNKVRAKTFMSAFYERFNHYPNHVTNFVMTDGTGTDMSAIGYQIPYCSDENIENGPEVLAYGHNKIYKFMIHRLNAKEAEELISLGITKVYNLNDYASDADGLDGAAANGRKTTPSRVSNWDDVTAVANKRPFMELCDIQDGIGVAMCGCGVNSAGGNQFLYVQGERAWAEEDLFGRIILGLGPESELVTSGIVSNAAYCPGSIQNAENFSSGHYYLILPRLSATSERLADSGTTFTALWGASNLTYARLENVTVVSWAKGDSPSAGYVLAGIGGNVDHYKTRQINLAAAMEPWDFDTNRHRYDEIWGVDIANPVGTLNGGS